MIRFLKLWRRQHRHRAPTGRLVAGKEPSPNICHERRLVFLHNPKCAGSSMRDWLWPGRGLKTNHSLPHDICHRKTWRDYFTFVIVRDPYDRFASGYYYFVNRSVAGLSTPLKSIAKMSPPEYFEAMTKINHSVMRHQHPYLHHKFSDEPIDMVIHFNELVPRGLTRIKDWITVRGEFPHVNASRRAGTRSRQAVEHLIFSDKKFLAEFNDYYAQDFKELNYRRIRPH